MSTTAINLPACCSFQNGILTIRGEIPVGPDATPETVAQAVVRFSNDLSSAGVRIEPMAFDWTDKGTPASKLIDELEDRFRTETDAIRDAVDDLVDLEITSPSPWSYGAKGEHVPLPEDEARQFRVDIRSEYVVDVTGDICEQTVEALQGLAADLTAAAERLQFTTVAETEDDAE